MVLTIIIYYVYYVLFKSCQCEDIKFGSVEEVFDTEKFRPCTIGACQAMSSVRDMDMIMVIL